MNCIDELIKDYAKSDSELIIGYDIERMNQFKSGFYFILSGEIFDEFSAIFNEKLFKELKFFITWNFESKIKKVEVDIDMETLSKNHEFLESKELHTSEFVFINFLKETIIGKQRNHDVEYHLDICAFDIDGEDYNFSKKKMTLMNTNGKIEWKISNLYNELK